MGVPWGWCTDVWIDRPMGHIQSGASLWERYQAGRREDGESSSGCIWRVSNWQKVKWMSNPTLKAVDGWRGHGGTSRCGGAMVREYQRRRLVVDVDQDKYSGGRKGKEELSAGAGMQPG